MPRRSVFTALMALTVVLSLGFTSRAVRAQDATPVTDQVGTSVVVASGLVNPRGFTWGPDGALYVASAGNGGPNDATEQAPTSEILGPFKGGPSASVVRIENGCPVTVADGLPSTLTATGEALGAEAVAFLGGALYVSVDGGGPVHANPDQPSGVYRIEDDGTTTLVADLSAWVRANPVSELPPDFDPDAAGYSMVADETAGVLWVGDPNSGQVLTVTPDGTITRVADLSAGHPVPTQLALAPDGGVYVGALTAVPFPDGAAKVMKVEADGTVTDVWTGLTTVVAVAVGPDGTLYALELSTGNLQEPPFLQPGSGRVVRQTGPDTLEEVAGGLMFPITMAFGPDGGIHVATPAIGADNGEGLIIRLTGLDGTPAAIGMGAPCPGTGATPVPATPAA
jgi:hypothetical protein